MKPAGVRLAPSRTSRIVQVSQHLTNDAVQQLFTPWITTIFTFSRTIKSSALDVHVHDVSDARPLSQFSLPTPLAFPQPDSSARSSIASVGAMP